jgi:hypothetical protein
MQLNIRDDSGKTFQAYKLSVDAVLMAAPTIVPSSSEDSSSSKAQRDAAHQAEEIRLNCGKFRVSLATIIGSLCVYHWNIYCREPQAGSKVYRRDRIILCFEGIGDC